MKLDVILCASQHTKHAPICIDRPTEYEISCVSYVHTDSYV